MTGASPRSLGFSMPPEWEAHEAVWLAWPSHRELWGDDLEPARAELVELCRAIATGGGAEALHVLVLDERGEEEAAGALDGAGATVHRVPFGDIWLRDTGPLFVTADDGRMAAVRFRFDGWGGKYRFEFDDEVALRVAELAGADVFEAPIVCEGGAVEVDGEGTCITTRACLLDPHRNPGADASTVEACLADYLGADCVVWLERGLAGDHTDGHVDTLARFVAPGRVVCASARERDDPNAEVLAEVERALDRATDACGRRLEVVTLPSPGLVSVGDGDPMPASYLNYYLSNSGVVVPVYGSRYDREAVEAVAQCFPGRDTLAVPARHILTGGGAFHCITQQQPMR